MILTFECSREEAPQPTLQSTSSRGTSPLPLFNQRPQEEQALTDWFWTLSPEDQAAPLVRAAAQHQQLRKEQRSAEDEALVMRHNRRKKVAQEKKRSQKKITITKQLKCHNGPCNNSAVRNLLKTYCKKGQRLLAVQAELNTTAPFSRENHLSYKYQRRCHSS